MFMDYMKEVLLEEQNICVTENGAVGYRTSGKKLVDINFSVTSMRRMNEKQIVDKFVKAFYENKLLAVKWLFFARDVRNGLGERRLFRICMKYLALEHPEIAQAVAALIPEYGRFDDWLCFFDTKLEAYVIGLIQVQLEADMKHMQEGCPISLLAKWLPSVNSSSKNAKYHACKIYSQIGMTEGAYRKMLSKMRAYLKVVEVSMSQGEWKSIEYSNVPSRANLIYNSAFLRNDEVRRRDYLKLLVKGEAKIHADVLYPHDIVHKYLSWGYSYYSDMLKTYNIAYEELWKALPDYVGHSGNTICVSDGSGSMSEQVGGTNIRAIEVAIALSVYFAERSSGQFKNKYITFSRHPQIVDLNGGVSLREKIKISLLYREVSTTDIEQVFQLILQTAVKYKMSQKELPANVLILSDMEFDSCAKNCNERIFKVLAEEYGRHGYLLPRLVFWNINSRTGVIPVRENSLGVALVSGFSPAIVKMVLSNKVDPYECLLEQLQDVRYDAVEVALSRIVC